MYALIPISLPTWQTLVYKNVTQKIIIKNTLIIRIIITAFDDLTKSSCVRAYTGTCRDVCGVDLIHRGRYVQN